MEEPSLIDRSIMEMRSRQLSDETIQAISEGSSKYSLPSVMPWFEVKQMRIDGKDRMVPFIGIRGEF